MAATGGGSGGGSGDGERSWPSALSLSCHTNAGDYPFVPGTPLINPGGSLAALNEPGVTGDSAQNNASIHRMAALTFEHAFITQGFPPIGGTISHRTLSPSAGAPSR